MIRNIITDAEEHFTGKDAIDFSNAVTKGFNANLYSDIYLTGYGYIMWVAMPEFLKDEKIKKSIGDFEKMSAVLMKAVRIPSVNLNSVEVTTGFANTNVLSIPTTIDMDRSLQIVYNELSGTPMTKFHQTWISGIRDYASGVSDIKDYGIKTYTANLLYITTKPVHYEAQGSFGSHGGGTPNKRMVETAHFFTNVFPTTDNQANFSMDLESSDKVEVEMNYKFSQMFMGAAVNKFAEDQLKNMISLKDMDSYNIDATGATPAKATGNQ